MLAGENQGNTEGNTKEDSLRNRWRHSILDGILRAGMIYSDLTSISYVSSYLSNLGAMTLALRMRLIRVVRAELEDPIATSLGYGLDPSEGRPLELTEMCSCFCGSEVSWPLSGSSGGGTSPVQSSEHCFRNTWRPLKTLA